MATTEELFISVSPQIYRGGKSATLMGQTDLLQTLKHLQNLKVLSRQKNDLKKQLHKLISSAMTQVNTLQSKMPTSQIPKTIQHHEELILKSKPKTRTTFSKRDEIEEELQLIQAKLQELNSY